MAQKVTLGRTHAGRPGLFTRGYLAWAISEKQFQEFSRDRAAFAAFCRRLRFEPGDRP